MYLPDVNAWLALAFAAHVHHGRAQAWFNSRPAGTTSYFCRPSQMGFLRLANNPKAFPGAAVSQDQAWKLYDSFLANPRVGFAAEPAGLDALWRSFTQSRQFAPNAWADAHLAAFAIVGGYEVVTFDTGFRQYPGLSVTVL
jgi:toxin-antitoxin system PIN domain toxin